MTDWPQLHAQVIETFIAGWKDPTPHGWDAFLADDVEFVQPMLRDGRGPEFWWDESARLLRLLPDLRGEVLDWSANKGSMFIHLRFTATLAGRPLMWRAVDLLRLDTAGKVLRRESFFDSEPLTRTVVRRPGAWPAWWRSGIAPLDWRRRLPRGRP